ncbi:MAG: hypothetical protein OFPI_08710 [Osedax symbiont Rs2]|nr:MAG: hypothetical protein OFPI_08710 [Osedax symbiont Rs2]
MISTWQKFNRSITKCSATRPLYSMIIDRYTDSLKLAVGE